jgi:hypothetical protein
MPVFSGGGRRARLVASLASLVLAGCGAVRTAPVTPPEGAEAEIRLRARPFGVVGIEFGIHAFSAGQFDEWFDDAVYYGIRYSDELSLNAGVSITAGQYRAATKVAGGEDLEVWPFRVTLELGSQLGFTQSRWFVGAGAGYLVMDDLPSSGKVDLWPADLPDMEDEPSAHAVLGFEFRNETAFVTRLEGGHSWAVDSGADGWTATFELAMQF